MDTSYLRRLALIVGISVGALVLGLNRGEYRLPPKGMVDAVLAQEASRNDLMIAMGILPGFGPMGGMLGGGNTSSQTAFDPSHLGTRVSLSNGNRTASYNTTGSFDAVALGLVGKSTGKWYFEIKVGAPGNEMMIGLSTSSANLNNYLGSDAAGSYGYPNTGGGFYSNGGSLLGSSATYTNNDVIGVAVDFGASKAWWSKNNAWQNSGNPSTGSNGFSITAATLYPAVSVSGSGSSATITASQSYAPPSGYSAWS